MAVGNCTPMPPGKGPKTPGGAGIVLFSGLRDMLSLPGQPPGLVSIAVGPVIITKGRRIASAAGLCRRRYLFDDDGRAACLQRIGFDERRH